MSIGPTDTSASEVIATRLKELEKQRGTLLANENVNGDSFAMAVVSALFAEYIAQVALLAAELLKDDRSAETVREQLALREEQLRLELRSIAALMSEM